MAPIQLSITIKIMDAITARLSRDFADMKSEIKTDETIESWPLMDPILIAVILISYLLFTLKIGPEIMKNRTPFDLKVPMIIYNAFQVFYNLRIVLALFTTTGAISFTLENMCEMKAESQADSMSHPLFRVGCNLSWCYLFSKITDLLDTIFMVLRKKQSHVTFLHVYHHASMVFGSWAYLKYIRGYQGVIMGSLNAFVHTVMYFYYFLAAFGDTFKPFLFWKTYVTKLQLTQFVIMMSYLGGLLLFDCKLPKVYSYYALVNVLLFIYLFVDFYRKTYKKLQKQRTE